MATPPRYRSLPSGLHRLLRQDSADVRAGQGAIFTFSRLPDDRCANSSIHYYFLRRNVSSDAVLPSNQ